MNSNWLMPTSKRYTHPGDDGTRPSGDELLALVDTDDPAFPLIAAALAEMKQAGVELTKEAVAMAVQLGRHRFNGKPMPSPRIPRPRKSVPSPRSIVYYVRRGSVIKIGTTVDPYHRFAELMPDEILAFEPGGQPLEYQRHELFHHLRLGGTEHFRIASELIEHAKRIREQHGEPDPSWPIMATLGQQALGREPFQPAPPPQSPVLVTATMGANECGLRHNTVHMWVHRGVLKPVGKDERGRAVYFLDHVRYFAARSSATPIA